MTAAQLGRTPLPLVQLHVGVGHGAVQTATIQLKIDGQAVRLEITVPTGPTSLRQLLPIWQGLTNLVVDNAVQEVERHGEAISCRKGCGACCRQPVPVSLAEAHALRHLVEAMPEPRRSVIRARFAAAVRRLDAVGLGERFRPGSRVTDAPLQALGLDYFHLGVACPFLEEESCSIHPDRPLACREYLVSSPASACAQPTAATVRMIPLATRVSQALVAQERQTTGDATGWVLLTLALEWAETHPETAPTTAGPALVQAVFSRLTGKPVG